MVTPEDDRNSPRSQIEVTEAVRKVAAAFGDVYTPRGLVDFRDYLFQNLIFRPFNDESRQHEASIRWKRTASEILEGGYVYDRKACTDIVIAFCALCCAKGLETHFLKLRNERGATHSIAEIRLPEGWYFFDVAIRNSEPQPGEFDAQSDYRGWKLWKKGRDAWELGLLDYESIRKIRG